MKKNILFLILLFTLNSCDDIIEVPDISGNVVTILAPTENSVLVETEVNFSWDLIEDAEQYKLQIATPNFETATQIVLDTTIASSNFTRTLELGSYQWRIRAENSDYQTLYTTQSFNIE